MAQIKNLKLAGHTVHFPEIGETLVPEDGIIDVSVFLEEKLLEMGWQSLNGATTAPIDPVDLTTVENQFSSMSLEDLISMAEQAELPKNEWEKLSKNVKAGQRLMAAYLTKKTLNVVPEAEAPVPPVETETK